MVVDTVAIGTVYDALAGKMIDTLETLFNSHEVDATQKATVIAQGLTTILNLSVNSVQQQPLTDAQAAAVTAQSAADTSIKLAQKGLIDNQSLTEVEKKDLTMRQVEAYDDQLRIKEAELLTNVVGMMGAGGATFSTADDGETSILTTMYNKLNAITPKR